MSDKKVLASVCALSIAGIRPSLRRIAERTFDSPEEARESLGRLTRKALLERKGRAFELTKSGRSKLKVVMIGGAFEIIHPGHIHTIREAKRLGDVLVVVVATDKSVSRNKGRSAITGEATRVDLVSSLRDVDAAILGKEGSIYDTLTWVRPDVVALGYDQKHREDEIEREAGRRGLHVEVKRLGSPIPSVKTSRIVSQFV